MKTTNVILANTLVFIQFMVSSCSKEQPLSPVSKPTESHNDFDLRDSGGPKYGPIACWVYSGGQSCAGTRCGSPNGNSCPGPTACQCIERSNRLIGGYTIPEINQFLLTQEGQDFLISKGFQILDE